MEIARNKYVFHFLGDIFLLAANQRTLFMCPRNSSNHCGEIIFRFQAVDLWAIRIVAEIVFKNLQVFFQNMKVSQEKDSEYENLKMMMSRLERWTHQLYPKWQMDTTLQKIEALGTKNLVKNNIKRIRTNEVSDHLDGMGLPEEVNRRGETTDSQPANAAEELFEQAFQVVQISEFYF